MFFKGWNRMVMTDEICPNLMKNRQYFFLEKVRNLFWTAISRMKNMRERAFQ